MLRSPLRIGTRSSELALWQAERVGALLAKHGVDAEYVKIETTGDRDRVSEFGALGAKGVFVKEIENALLDKRIDLAVHSLKDLPTGLPRGLVLGAVVEREDYRDALISYRGESFSELKHGATIATGSLRRAAQALSLRPDLNVIPLRGNVPTRIKKIRGGAADATMLAVAGLERLELAREIAEILPIEKFTPAMGQGAIAIESREGELQDLLGALENPEARIAADAERVFLAAIGAGCRTPAGVVAYPHENAWAMTVMMASEDGQSIMRASRFDRDATQLPTMARKLAEELLASADDAIRKTLAR